MVSRRVPSPEQASVFPPALPAAWQSGRTASPNPSPLPVSVLIPAYNRAAMLRRSLGSVWSQRPSLPGEVIVVDDGSVDETAQVAGEMGATVVRHPRNLGLSAARNTGLTAARYSWIALLDSDDEWLSHHLATLWPLLDDNVLVAGSALQCGADPRNDWFAGPFTQGPLRLHSGDQLIYPSNIIRVSASIVRRELALEVGGFRAHHGVSEDFDMWLRLLERGSGVCSPRVSVYYHVHGEQMSAQSLRTMHLGTVAAVEAHIQRTGGSRVSLERWEAIAAWENLREAPRAGADRRAVSWGVRIASTPQRLIGFLGFVVTRIRTGRRSAALRRAGL